MAGELERDLRGDGGNADESPLEEGKLLMTLPPKVDEMQDPAAKIAALEGEALLALLFSFVFFHFLT